LPCWPPRSFYPKTVEITCCIWNAHKLIEYSWVNINI
jgi:hypothetical protein